MEEKFLSTELDILAVVALAWTTSIDEEYQIVGYDPTIRIWSAGPNFRGVLMVCCAVPSDGTNFRNETSIQIHMF